MVDSSLASKHNEVGIPETNNSNNKMNSENVLRMEIEDK